jgi:hypothetical protein
VLLEFPTGFRLMRGHESPFSLAASVTDAVFSCSLRSKLSLTTLARTSKVDDVAHPLTLDGTGFVIVPGPAMPNCFVGKCALSVATE